MVEAAEINAPEWLSEFEGLSEDSVAHLSKYDAIEKALDSIAGKEKQLRSTLRVPTETDPEEKHVKFREVINKYTGVPEKPEDYEIEHPELPEGMAHDAEFENKMRQTAKELGVSKKALAGLAKVFGEYQINNHIAHQNEAKAVIEKYIAENGQERANQILGYTDKEGKQIMGTAKRGWMGLSKELNLDYVDNHNAPQSQLIDSLEKINPGGVLGNDPVMINIGQWLWDTRYKEGSTPGGTAPEGGGEAAAFSAEFYAKTDDGKDVD